MTGTLEAGLDFVLLLALSVASASAAVQQSQDQANPPAGQDQGTPSVPAQVRVSEGVSKGLLLTKVQPKYPEKARRKRIQGTVVLRAVINREGDIADLSLVSGDPLLAKSAIKAVKQWKYNPYLFKGDPVAVDTQIQVNFTLSEN